MKKAVKIAGIIFILVALFAISFPEPFFRYFLVPALSPFFPDFGPFQASVSIRPNTAPFIADLSPQIYVCEGNRLNHFFNVTDLEGDALTIDINPKNPFFVIPTSTSVGVFTTAARIISAFNLTQQHVDTSLGYRNYAERVSVCEQPCILTSLSDFEDITITVIEVNNRPFIQPIGVQTVWTRGEDSIFFYQTQVNDEEDGNQNGGNLTLNLTFLNAAPVFNISANGTMYFVPNQTLNLSIVSLPLTYNLQVCARDMGITPLHPQSVNICNENGSMKEFCEPFSLTVTDENRPPRIENYFPLNLSFSVPGTEQIYFNITAKDPDGTIPDAYWYVDNSFLEYDTGSFVDEFSYTFGCGVSGNHSVLVKVTDGLLNASLQWNVSVQEIACPPQGRGGGGGGGGIVRRCVEEWVCLDWQICQDVAFSSEAGRLTSEDERFIREQCRLDLIDQCGFQLRNCFDTNACNKTLTMPGAIQHCFFVENPSCSDGVKDCHDNSCETLVDCGGPCGACPTCSDGIKNQGERGIDCEGPCPKICKERPGFFEIVRFQYIIYGFLLLLILVIIWQITRIWRERRKMQRLGVYGKNN